MLKQNNQNLYISYGNYRCVVSTRFWLTYKGINIFIMEYADTSKALWTEF